MSLAGNMHYVVYRWVLPLLSKLQGVETTESYWFPDATRYIGFDPDVPDKTIHEFPCYSFVLGDLHAHVVNIMFVLLVLGLLYAWMQWMWKRKSLEDVEQKINWKRELDAPHPGGERAFGHVPVDKFLGFCHLFCGGRRRCAVYECRALWKTSGCVLGVTLAQGAEVLAISYAVILPFTLKFETMVQGVALAQNHSLPHQLLILWGLPVLVLLLFFVSLFLERKNGSQGRICLA